VQQNQLKRAEEYYDSSLEISDREAPKKAIQVKEKVADYYNKNNQFDEEIKLRKQTIQKLEEAKITPIESNKELSDVSDAIIEKEETFLPESKAPITTQGTKLKIATAYKAKKEYKMPNPIMI